MLDYETTKSTYTVMVTATDPSGESGNDRDTITVTINVTNVDESPELAEPTDDAGLAAIDHPENSSIPTLLTQDPAYTALVSTYTATDDEDDEDDNVDLTWSLSGADMDQFELSDVGTLTFESSPDFEAPADSGRNNVYNVTVEVKDSDDMTDSRDVAVTVTNVEEGGTVTLSNLQPEDGVPIRAELDDPDGGVTGLKWQWSFTTGTRDGGTYIPIAGATSATYTPTTADVGNFLQATATYTDNAVTEDDSSTGDIDESMDTASTASANEVQEHDDANEPPEFPDQDRHHPRAPDGPDKIRERRRRRPGRPRRYQQRWNPYL